MDLERIVVEGQLPGKEGMERRKVREELIIKGIASAARSMSAWIIDGGTEKGVMKMLGQMQAHHHTETPVIGFATWGCLANRDTLIEEGFYEKISKGETLGKIFFNFSNQDCHA